LPFNFTKELFMFVEACTFEENTNLSTLDLSTEQRWGNHIITLGGDLLVHLLAKSPMQQPANLRHQIRPMKGSAGGSIEAKANSEGESSLVGEVHVSSKNEDGGKVSVTAEGSIKNDGSGNVKADGGIKVSFDKDF
jgi:hypothetical protein